MILRILGAKICQDRRQHDKCIGNIAVPKGVQINLLPTRKPTENLNVQREEMGDTGNRALSKIFSKMISNNDILYFNILHSLP